jgi:hypothetical protein
VEKQQILILIFDLTKPGTNPRNTTLEASMQVATAAMQLF